ncbi:hypothetical protein [Endozoicomonas sp. ALB091]|uniref:hypothetical protein n=1 Tax=Endozoicomonas sp. ALB091 TaxID=3403073 RepID=UPI003BB80D59
MSIFNELEMALRTDQSDTAKVLGIGKSSYSMYKTGSKKTPLYIRYSIEVILMLSEEKKKELRNKRLAK